MLKVRFIEKNNNIFKDKISHYSDIEQYQGIFIFLPQKYKYIIVDENEQSDISIVGIQHTNNNLLRDNEMNIMICVENLSVGRGHYKHFNIFNKYNNDKLDLYYYSDVCQLTQNTIPTPYCFIKQYKFLENKYESILQNKFEDKLFCLSISKNYMNKNKNKIIELLSQFGNIDHISSYDNIISDKSCYNSPELLSIFNKYKFIICFENSSTNGYITEKIFNVFLSKSIPIYDGADDIGNYINEEAFIRYDQSYLKKILYLENNKEKYEYIVNMPKFNKNNSLINDFEKQLEKVFDSHLERKNIIPK